MIIIKEIVYFFSVYLTKFFQMFLAMVEALVSKITIWESEKESEFLFDGV